MKLEVKAFRYLTKDDWRVLTAVELGSRNHEVVPTQIISQIASLRGGVASANRSISNLAKPGLIAKMKNMKYEGYRLTYGGLDYLALHAHIRSGALYSIGPRIGVGKESDIYACCSPSGSMLVLKLHRLGRISFRAVKTTRDYLHGRKTGSWLYLSRLAAAREFAALEALYDADFPVPRPLACNRHAVLMERIDGIPLYKVNQAGDPAKLYEDLSGLAARLAKCGIIHGDLNEFNVMLAEENCYQDEPEKTSDFTSGDQRNSDANQVKPILIDFPQIISTAHPDAAEYFARDINCLKRYFSSKLKFEIESPGPTLKEALDSTKDDHEGQSHPHLDIVIEAAGFSLQKTKESEQLRRKHVESHQDSFNKEEEEGEEEEENEEKTEIGALSANYIVDDNGDDNGDDDDDNDDTYDTHRGTDLSEETKASSRTCTSNSNRDTGLAMTELRIGEQEPKENRTYSPIPQSERRSKASSRPTAKAVRGWAI